MESSVPGAHLHTGSMVMSPRDEITRDDQRLALLTAEEDPAGGLVFGQEAVCHIADLVCDAVEGESVKGSPD